MQFLKFYQSQSGPRGKGVRGSPPRGLGKIMGNFDMDFQGDDPSIMRKHYGDMWGNLMLLLMSLIMFLIMFRTAALRNRHDFLLPGAPEPHMPPYCPWGRSAHREAWIRPLSSSQRRKENKNENQNKMLLMQPVQGGHTNLNSTTCLRTK